MQCPLSSAGVSLGTTSSAQEHAPPAVRFVGKRLSDGVVRGLFGDHLDAVLLRAAESWIQAHGRLVQHRLLVRQGNILQRIHETHVEVCQGDVVGVLPERVLQLLCHLIEAPKALEEEEAQDGPGHWRTGKHDNIDGDQRGEGHEQQAQQLREGQRERHICNLEAIVEAQHAIGKLLVHSGLDRGCDVNVLHGICEVPDDPVHHRGHGVIGLV
mmetsp:Transcript_25379/g.60399  ORF Transcript_25379/g.60399 Transcript_25379/m.60399 type:complete len:213 (-) Transcript_25379:700-1338(-)